MGNAGTTAGHQVVLLCGGVGGAKLAEGLQRCNDRNRLTVVVNTADDLEHYGLHVSPDVDTVMYTLAGLADASKGWGLAGDTATVMGAIAELGEDAWFQLGDRDLATHLVRTEALRAGERLTDVTTRLATNLGVSACVLPMSDDRVRTMVHTDEGELAFQDWFVRRRCEPTATSVRYDGVESAMATPEVAHALRTASTVVLGPSNPYLSIGPILALPGVRQALRDTTAPVVAVSPIVGGKALKGPAAAMLSRLAGEASASVIARLYVDFLDGVVIDSLDRALAHRIEDQGVRVHVTDTVMGDGQSRETLARHVLAFAQTLRVRA